MNEGKANCCNGFCVCECALHKLWAIPLISSCQLMKQVQILLVISFWPCINFNVNCFS